jgi:hypothetical protein
LRFRAPLQSCATTILLEVPLRIYIPYPLLLSKEFVIHKNTFSSNKFIKNWTLGVELCTIWKYVSLVSNFAEIIYFIIHSLYINLLISIFSNCKFLYLFKLINIMVYCIFVLFYLMILYQSIHILTEDSP